MHVCVLSFSLYSYRCINFCYLKIFTDVPSLYHGNEHISIKKERKNTAEIRVILKKFRKESLGFILLNPN